MKVTRIYTGDDDLAHFEDLDFPMRETRRFGPLFDFIPPTAVIFRETPGAEEQDYHTVPLRQFGVILSGGEEVGCSDGTTRQFGPGDIILATDTTGKGHRTRDLEGTKRVLYVPLPEDIDPDTWRR